VTWTVIGELGDTHKQRNQWQFLGLAPTTATLYRCKFSYSPEDKWEGTNFPRRVYAWQKIRFSALLAASSEFVSLPLVPRVFWEKDNIPLISQQLPPELAGEVGPSYRIEVMFTSRFRRSDPNWFTTQFTLEADL